MTRCFDKLEEIIVDVERDFPNKKASKESVDKIKNVCEMIDTIADAYKGVRYRYKIDPCTLEIILGIECGEIIVDGFEPPNKFYCVSEMAKKIFFEHGRTDDYVVVTFVFDGVWEDID